MGAGTLRTRKLHRQTGLRWPMAFTNKQSGQKKNSKKKTLFTGRCVCGAVRRELHTACPSYFEKPCSSTYICTAHHLSTLTTRNCNFFLYVISTDVCVHTLLLWCVCVCARYTQRCKKKKNNYVGIKRIIYVCVQSDIILSGIPVYVNVAIYMIILFIIGSSRCFRQNKIIL